jgi:hypothetical protein
VLLCLTHAAVAFTVMPAPAARLAPLSTHKRAHTHTPLQARRCATNSCEAWAGQRRPAAGALSVHVKHQSMLTLSKRAAHPPDGHVCRRCCPTQGWRASWPAPARSCRHSNAAARIPCALLPALTVMARHWQAARRVLGAAAARISRFAPGSPWHSPRGHQKVDEQDGQQHADAQTEPALAVTPTVRLLQHARRAPERLRVCRERVGAAD